VAPIVPKAMPTSASASASLMPSPTMTTVRRFGWAWSARTTELLLRRLLRVDALDAELARHPLGDLRLVAGNKRGVLDPSLAQARNEQGGVLAQTVVEQDDRGRGAVDRDVHLGGAPIYGLPDREAMRLEPAGAADEHRVSFDDPLDAVAERLLGALGQRELQFALLGPGHERGRERMRREPVERSSEPQHLAFWQAVQGGDVGELRVAERDRTGLVEQHRARLAQPLDRPGALDHRTSAA
jgi:hypothetical protein